MNRILKKEALRTNRMVSVHPFFLGCYRQSKREALILAAASALDMIYLTVCQNWKDLDETALLLQRPAPQQFKS